MKYTYFENKNYLEIAKKEKVSTLVSKAIEAYNLTSLKGLKIDDPYKFNDMQKVVGFLLKAINEKKKIMVYGDYDVDGICSISILKRMFSLLDSEIGYYMPNRYNDGYGLNMTMAQEIIDKKYDILICIDNGINAIEPIKLCKDNGMQVLVFDHHELLDKLPECDYYLHPNLSNFSEYNMCASTVGYYLSLALLNKEDPLIAIYAGIATISDVMPLVGQNKLIVANALKLLNTGKYNVFNAIIEGDEYTESVLSMSLIPKLNSVGRVIKDIKVNNVIKYMFETDLNKKQHYLEFIKNCNNYRKEISNEFYSKVCNEPFNKIIVTKDDNLLEGVCGIIASRLTSTYQVPSVVFSLTEDKKYYKGSCRSIEGVDIVDCLKKLDYLVSFGGHKKAAGVTINAQDFLRFKKDIEKIVEPIEIKEASMQAILVNEDEIDYKSYQELLKYGPFGEGNPYPVFAIENIDKSKVGFSKDKKHLIIKLNDTVTLLGFNLASNYKEKYNNYRCIFTLDKNNLFKNKLSCKCIDVIGG